MSDRIQDIWQDLREKRLWPIALVLVLAIVAVPVLLTKSAAQPPVTDPVAVAPAPDESVAVQLDGGAAGSTGTGSSLDEFAEKDPFTPPKGIVDSANGAATATLSSSAGDGTQPTGDGGAGGQVDGGSPPSSTPNAPAPDAPPVTRTETAEYEYVADVTFWAGNRRRTFRGLRKLDMLPNQAAPILIFMGTSGEGGNAVFLVDSTLQGAGEGRCVPSGESCAYVHIGPGSEHAFSTVEGDSYRLRIDEIRRVKVTASSARRARRSARTSVGPGAAGRRFELPSLTDLVEVSTTRTTAGQTHSSDAPDGR